MRKREKRSWIAALLALALWLGPALPAYAVSGQVTFTGIDTLMIYNPAVQAGMTMSTGAMGGEIVTETAGTSGAEDPTAPDGYLLDFGALLREEQVIPPELMNAGSCAVVAEDFPVGSTRTFFYWPNYLYSGESAPFTCLYEGEYCRVWGYQYDNDGEAEQLGAEFDTGIFGTNTELFGSARYMEEGAKLNILVYPMKDTGIAGFFLPTELLSAEEMGEEYAARYNSGMPIIHLNSAVDAETPDGTALGFSDLSCATAAHEFQHLIALTSALQGSGDEEVVLQMGVWLDEAMSKQAEEMNYPGEVTRWGYVSRCYNGSARIASGQSLYDFSTGYNDIGVYGQGFLFSEYLKKQYGGAGVFADIHSHWRTAERAARTDAHALYQALPATVVSAVTAHAEYPASVRTGFRGAEEEFLSKLNLAFQMAVYLKQDSGIYGISEACGEAAPAVYTDAQCDIAGGGRIFVKTRDGSSYAVPSDADSGLIYVGFKDGRMVFPPVTAERYCRDACTVSSVSSDPELGTVSVADGMILAAPAPGCGYAAEACSILSGSAVVERIGDQFLVTPRSDCTVQINFEAKNHSVDVWDGTVADSIPAEGSVYTVETCAQLARLALMVNGGDSFAGKTVVLAGNLDLNGMEWTPIGANSRFPFSGVLEGGGYTVCGLTIGSAGSPRSGDFTGLFGYVSGAGSAIRGLRLEQVAVYGNGYTGGLAGYCYGASISDCHASGLVSGTGNVGLLSGYANEVSFTDCGAEGSVQCSGSIGGGLVGMLGGSSPVVRCRTVVTVSGGSLLGGLAGQIRGGSALGTSYMEVNSCFSHSRVSGGDTVGGLAGKVSNVRVAACYWTGLLSCGEPQLQGAMAGAYTGSPVFSGCYYDRTGCEMALAGAERTGAVALSPAEMKQSSSYYGWDLNFVWEIDESRNGGFPYLRWQTFGQSGEDVPALQLQSLAEREGQTEARFLLTLPDTDSVVVMLAAYRDGQLVSSGILEQTLLPGTSVVTLSVDLPVEEGLLYRAFLLSREDYSPLQGQLSFTLADLAGI